MVEEFVRILVGLAVVAGATVAVYYIGFGTMVYFEAPLLSTPIESVVACAVGLVVIGLIVSALGFSHLVGCVLLGIASDVREKD
jgi:uncharacterized membrane protein (DUF485 family)